ncbi:unnamed protein product [Lupinus luteus]|uniref:WRKY domain-containing protein n=1 Tax=Lupinus luteus TaxID=3873 RepID=A0AAV1XID5_LUPLU
MDSNTSPKQDSELSSDLKQETHASKKRKMVQKTVVMVKIGENVNKVKNEGLPNDFWSWRKYGQKPIKGSPYPRGYYRCSTCKGCSAKKQVERCRTDASMLIITYTSSHNHPASDDIPCSTNLVQQTKQLETQTTEYVPSSPIPKEEDQENKQEMENHNESTMTSDHSGTNEEKFHYLQSPTPFNEEVIDQDDIFKLNNQEKTHEEMDPLLEIEPMCYSQIKNLSAPKLEELDFFDELEELPMSSSFLDYTKISFSNERIPIVPS